MEDNNDNLSQTSPALQSSEEQGSKPKDSSKIITIICAILALAGIGFGVYEMLQASSAKQQIADIKVEIKNDDGTTTTLENGEIEIKDDAKTVIITETIKENDATDVKKVATGLINAFRENNINIGGYSVFGDGSSIPIQGTDIITSTNESYGFTTGVYKDQSIEDKIMHEGGAIATSYLTSHGFAHVQDLAYNQGLYYNQEKDIYCTTTGSSYPYSVNCTKSSWLTEDEKKFALELAEAANTTTIYAKKERIVDSSIAPYQRLIGSTAGAALLFYRVSPNDKWQFVAGTQGIISCDKYTEDAKKAFAGTECWDETTNSKATL